MSQNYTLEFKKKIVRIHDKDGRYRSINNEYGRDAFLKSREAINELMIFFGI